MWSVLQHRPASRASHDAPGPVGEKQCGAGQRSRGVFPDPAATVELLLVRERIQAGALQFLIGYRSGPFSVTED